MAVLVPVTDLGFVYKRATGGGKFAIADRGRLWSNLLALYNESRGRSVSLGFVPFRRLLSRFAFPSPTPSRHSPRIEF